MTGFNLGTWLLHSARSRGGDGHCGGRMPKLHLVGITPDHRGLVLSEHARAKRGDMVLEIDDRLLEAIDKAQRLRRYDEGRRLESNALPSKRELANGDTSLAGRPSPREIQQRLRAGETVTALARSSGTDEAWIQRFAAPVLAEKAIVIDQARSVTFTKRGVGPSAAALGPAVAANVIDRGVPLTLPDLDAGWGAYQHPEGGWHVTFTFPLRGRRQTAEWEIDPATGDLTARNRLASELGWRESGKKLPQPKPAKAPAAKRSAPTKAPAAAEPAQAEAEAPAPEEHIIQLLPLSEKADPLPPGEVREVSLRKPRKPPKQATKRAAAAAVTETPTQSVVSVPPAGSMPPTDLDVVDVVVDLRSPDDDDPSGDTAIPPAAREPAPIGSPPAPPGGPPAP
jgi:DUF3071 family protein